VLVWDNHLMKPKLDADALLSLTLIWLLVIGYVTLVYVVVLAIGMPHPFNTGGIEYTPPWWRNLIALILIALTFLPMYRWIRVRVRALIYGQHENPFPALVQLHQHFDSTPSPHSILPTIAETIAQTLKLPYVEIKAQIPETQGASVPLVTAVGSAPKNAAIEQVPLTYHGIAIGELRVAARGWDEPLSHSDLLVLEDLARQVGIALYAAQLTGNLQHARERLVMAREEERRRIRNDLHDGLAPTLSSLQLQLGALRNLVHGDPDQASVMIDEMRADLRDAISEIRQLVYDLRPPMLDELGLVGAIRNIKLEETGVHFEFIIPDPMPVLPAALEVAVYRITREAIQNVIKHAQATECVVRIEVVSGDLTLKVTDNGKSIPDQPHVGIGLHSMQERVAELGGTLSVQSCEGSGTCLTAQFPLEEKEVANP
jgi:two-component system NarL family sensor kinase